MNTTEKIIKQIQKDLLSMQDLNYRDFHSKLMPTIDKDVVIGVRTPQLRQYGKELAKKEEAVLFMEALPHKYYEENNLHAFLIEQLKEYDVCIHALNEFLPYVDNWATCDFMSPKSFKKHSAELFLEIRRWIGSKHPYTVRFAIGMLMKFYLDEAFSPEYLEMVAGVHSEEYYINMMIAWYYATALAKQYDAAISYLEENRLGVWVHNKTIQKAIESYRISDEQKNYLRTLKRKEA